MPLVEHLNELRRRLVVSASAIAVAIVPVFYFYSAIFDFLVRPFREAVVHLGSDAKLFLQGVADPFTLQIQIVTIGAVIASSPVWLFQLWRFITPGLHKNERRWAYAFVLTATPLLLAGAALAYWAMPVGLQVLFGFTPSNVSNLIAVDRYFDFFFRMVAAFSIGFLSPMVLVLLNFANILRASTIRSWWRGIIMVDLLFAAIATPTGDPVNMMIVATPIALLLVIAWGVAAINDSRRRKRGLLSDIDIDE
jgi:sec-independent protein translocase protein TatC